MATYEEVQETNKRLRETGRSYPCEDPTTEDGNRPPVALMWELLETAAKLTGYRMPDKLPDVVTIAPQGAMPSYACGLYSVRKEGPEAPLTNRLSLLAGWDANNVNDRGILLHELVHHCQYTAQLEWALSATTADVEFPAYAAQAIYLRDQGAPKHVFEPYLHRALDFEGLLELQGRRPALPKLGAMSDEDEDDAWVRSIREGRGYRYLANILFGRSPSSRAD